MVNSLGESLLQNGDFSAGDILDFSAGDILDLSAGDILDLSKITNPYIPSLVK